MGRGIVVLPESTARLYARPGVCHARISDIASVETALAWSSSRRSPLIAEFVRLAAVTASQLTAPTGTSAATQADAERIG
jgi:hypothetical protein